MVWQEKTAEARYYLSRSIQLLHQSADERSKSEFSQIFYNYGNFLFIKMKSTKR